MSATSFPNDAALFRSLKAGDERALEQLFRSRYDALIAEALPLLDGNGHDAGRAVEGVFEQLWRSRAEFETADDVASYLHSGVHAAAVRLKGRHATAQHFGDLSGPGAAPRHRAAPRAAPTADDAWAALRRALHAPAEHSEGAARRVVEHSRHEVAAALGGMAKPRPRGPMIAIGVGALALLGGLAWWMSGARDSAALSAGLAAPNARTVNTAAGQLGSVTLRDASEVRLGPESQLRIPSAFGDLVRGVELTGTAAFTVAPEHKHRFTVRARNVTVVAEGTGFAVRAYADEPFVTVRATVGNVEVRSPKGTASLAAGSTVAVDATGATRELTAAEAEVALGWTDGIVVAVDRPLREVLLVAKRWYGMQFLVPDTTLFDRTVTLRASLESAEEARSSIETSGGLTRVWEGTNMVLMDQSARPARPARPARR